MTSGGARRRRRRRPPTASRLKGPRKQKSFAYKLLKRGLANLMSPTSTSGVAPPLIMTCHSEQRGHRLIFRRPGLVSLRSGRLLQRKQPLSRLWFRDCNSKPGL
ncbi:hypothetical protein EVAR_87786_1 [Eumeta japonica]|uniref:Uncharacterized protein n=1 Tax=Eumeta variegata TaxID=151549 RepID=A0A4C1X3A0_EUMVA|nr:hypothetical protein EVAR_87786_1 [Eumeta japonica]